MRATLLAVMVLSAVLAGTPGQDWPSPDRDAGGQRHSPLEQITAANVSKFEGRAHSTPITYFGKDGQQYVVVPAGGGSYLGSPSGTTLVAFALANAAKPSARR